MTFYPTIWQNESLPNDRQKGILLYYTAERCLSHLYSITESCPLHWRGQTLRFQVYSTGMGHVSVAFQEGVASVRSHTVTPGTVD